MISRSQAVIIINEFLNNNLKDDWFLKIKPYIKAIILYGSVAKETNKLDSDIDILFIVPLKIEEECTSGEYFYQYSNEEINIVLRSIEKLRKIAEEKMMHFKKKYSGVVKFCMRATMR